MARTLAALGVVAAVIAGVFARDCGRGGSDYTLHIVGNSSSGYRILEGDKPVGGVYHVAFHGSIRWDIVNNADNGEAVRVRFGDGDFQLRDCPVNWTDCQEVLPNIPNGQTRSVSATPHPNAATGPANRHEFVLWVGLAPEGQMRPVDPELQIDDYGFKRRMAPILAGVAVAFFVAAWLKRKRRSI